MRLIFCSDPLNPREPDSLYLDEWEAACQVGFRCDLISYEALVQGDAGRAVRRVEVGHPEELALYRGWMMKPDQYRLLYDALMQRGVRLLNDPEAYRHTHYLPESYVVIRDMTPRTVWLPITITGEVEMDRVMEALQPSGGSPLILKDYVKSRKHEWDEACFIPSAANRAEVERVVRRFLELQGDDLNGGLVFREYVEFEPLATHSKSGMPLIQEYRLFYLDGHLLDHFEYWEEGDYSGVLPPTGEFNTLARRVQSRFFTMDVAKRRDGDWMIVELGDGQVAGLPEHADVIRFYERLRSLWPDR
jgi:hypothetical protein